MRIFHVVFLLSFVFSGVEGQTIEGHLFESGSDTPVILAEIFMLTESGDLVAQTVSNETGFFSVTAPDSGSFLIQAERMGYQAGVAGIFDLGEGGLITIEFRLRPRPVLLDTLGVSVEAQNARLELAGFYQRMTDESGIFMGPEELAEKPVALATGFFRNIPRLRIRQRPMGGNEIIIQGAAMISFTRSGICYPRVFIDGNEVFRGGREPARLDDVVSASEIAGIEVYRGPAEVPTRYAGVRSSCGVILVWTK
jgi:hypothetical protein